MEQSVENMCGLLVRSKLLTSEEVRAMYQRWQFDAKTNAGSATHFGKWLVSNHFITPYQSALLVRGHAEGFFLGPYKVLDRLGQGRMAGVYKAQHSLGLIVAVKVLPPSRTKDAQIFARFQREARLALCLKHVNVVRAFQVGEDNGLHYIVMEYLEGETLEEVLSRRGKLLPGEGVRLIVQALQGLQHMHEQNLVHRDLKPANLMLAPAPPKTGPVDSTSRSTIKILDIGLGRALFDEKAPLEMQDAQLTSEGVLLGTPDYLAPEQAKDAHGVDIRADIYSLGCVLYHVLTGQTPFPDANIVSQMVRHATEMPKPIRELNPGVPEALQQVVNVMLAKNPAQRYATPAQAAQALQPFMSASAAEASYHPEADPQMRAYLKSLEGDKGRDPALSGTRLGTPAAPVPVLPSAPATVGASATTPTANAPVRTPAAGVPASTPAASAPATAPAASAPPSTPAASAPATAPAASAPASASSSAHRHDKSKKHRRKRRQEISEVDSADVELIPVAAVDKVGSRYFGLSSRDWLLLGIGAGSVILAMLLVFWFVRKLPPATSTGNSFDSAFRCCLNTKPIQPALALEEET